VLKLILGERLRTGWLQSRELASIELKQQATFFAVKKIAR